ncbi:MAG: hypothetical protein K0B15_07335 [Lentimicrobium sp.]|nr:hypothetical protein [Lentimicrobium sp.]
MKQQVLTINGYDLFECVSALQKEIRRCNEKEAMYWAVELYNSGYAPYVWKRLVIISTEDIGLAYPMAPVIINALQVQFEKLSERPDKKKQCRLPYVQAVLFLTNAPKSRHTDWALNYHFDSHWFVDMNKKEIPDYAIDIHTRKGKAMGKTINNFFEEGSYVANHKLLNNEEFYKNECRRRWNSQEWIAVAKQRSAEFENRNNNPSTQGDLFSS